MLHTRTAARLARLVLVLPLTVLLATACEDGLNTTPAANELAAITVSPNPALLMPNGPQQFAAVGTDNYGTVVALAPVTWSVVASGGSINTVSGLFGAHVTLSTFPNTVRACNSTGTVCGFATVTVSNTPAGPGPSTPTLGSAAPYGILAGQSVSCVVGGTINADVGISPGGTLNGFGPGECTLTGTTELATPVAATAQTDLTAAYLALQAQACNVTVTPADLGGRTLAPGVYCAAAAMGVTGTVTLDGQGNTNAVWVFQVGSALTTSTTADIALIGGAQARNVYWQVGSSATLGTGTTFRGNILALQTITLNNTATMLGRALARNGSISLGTGNTITLP